MATNYFYEGNRNLNDQCRKRRMLLDHGRCNLGLRLIFIVNSLQSNNKTELTMVVYRSDTGEFMALYRDYHDLIAIMIVRRMEIIDSLR